MISRLNELLSCLNKINNLFERHNKSFKRVIMLLKRVNNLCVQDKKRKENVPSGVPYISDCTYQQYEIRALHKKSSCNVSTICVEKSRLDRLKSVVMPFSCLSARYFID